MKCSAFDKMAAKISQNKDLKAKVEASNKKEADGYTDFVGVIVHELTHTKPGGETSVRAPSPTLTFTFIISERSNQFYRNMILINLI